MFVSSAHRLLRCAVKAKKADRPALRQRSDMDSPPALHTAGTGPGQKNDPPPQTSARLRPAALQTALFQHIEINKHAEHDTDERVQLKQAANDPEQDAQNGDFCQQADQHTDHRADDNKNHELYDQ